MHLERVVLNRVNYGVFLTDPLITTTTTRIIITNLGAQDAEVAANLWEHFILICQGLNEAKTFLKAANNKSLSESSNQPIQMYGFLFTKKH